MKKTINLKIGMRTFKTGLAVSISFMICSLFNSKSPIFAGIGAIMAMQASVSESFIAGKNRMLGTFVGAFVGLLFSLALPHNPIFIGLGVIITIHLCYIMGWNKALQLAAIVFMSIALNPNLETKFSYSLFRIIDTFIGIIVGMIINYFISAPNMEQKIRSAVETLYNECKKIIYSLIWKHEDVNLKDLKSDVNSLTESYNALIKDIDLNLFENKDSNSYSKILSVADSIETNISLLSKMDKVPFIEGRNQRLLKELFHKALDPREDVVKEDIDIVYNYHLNQSLNMLLEIKDFLLEHSSEMK